MDAILAWIIANPGTAIGLATAVLGAFGIDLKKGLAPNAKDPYRSKTLQAAVAILGALRAKNAADAVRRMSER